MVSPDTLTLIQVHFNRPMKIFCTFRCRVSIKQALDLLLRKVKMPISRLLCMGLNASVPSCVRISCFDKNSISNDFTQDVTQAEGMLAVAQLHNVRQPCYIHSDS